MRGILNGSSLAGGTPVRGRVKNDYYATPPESTQALLNVLELNGSILEPACGEGHISEVLRNNYPNSEIVSTDLIDRGYGEGGIDFLEHTYDRTFTNVITNPPFKYMREFVEKALEISDEKVMMFGKIQFLEGKGRKVILQKEVEKYPNWNHEIVGYTRTVDNRYGEKSSVLVKFWKEAAE